MTKCYWCGFDVDTSQKRPTFVFSDGRQSGMVECPKCAGGTLQLFDETRKEGEK